VQTRQFYPIGVATVGPVNNAASATTDAYGEAWMGFPNPASRGSRRIEQTRSAQTPLQVLVRPEEGVTTSPPAAYRASTLHLSVRLICAASPPCYQNVHD
jgi:hypothetical protein